VPGIKLEEHVEKHVEKKEKHVEKKGKKGKHVGKKGKPEKQGKQEEQEKQEPSDDIMIFEIEPNLDYLSSQIQIYVISIYHDTLTDSELESTSLLVRARVFEIHLSNKKVAKKRISADSDTGDMDLEVETDNTKPLTLNDERRNEFTGLEWFEVKDTLNERDFSILKAILLNIYADFKIDKDARSRSIEEILNESHRVRNLDVSVLNRNDAIEVSMFGQRLYDPLPRNDVVFKIFKNSLSAYINKGLSYEDSAKESLHSHVVSVGKLESDYEINYAMYPKPLPTDVSDIPKIRRPQILSLFGYCGNSRFGSNKNESIPRNALWA
jgi:hypothetical protein